MIILYAFKHDAVLSFQMSNTAEFVCRMYKLVYKRIKM